MMAAARAWLTAVVSVTLLLSVVQTLTPKGSLREIASFVGGLLLLAVLLRPLGSVDLSAVSLNLDAYRQTVEQRQAELEQEGLIQRFEYTVELAWKVLQDILKY